jgi:tetratricopeptide (TPR) repeat protein
VTEERSTGDKENNKVRVATIVMSLLLGVGIAAAAAAPETPGATPPPEIPALDVYRYALQRAMKQVSEEELADAYPALLGVIRSPVFDQLKSAEQHWALFVAGLVALDLDKPAEAHPLLVRACAMPEADGDDWVGRLNAARRLDLSEDLILAVTQIARRWPDTLRTLYDQVVGEAVMQARHVPRSEPVLHELLDALYTAKWKMEYDIEPSILWRDLAALELDRGNLARAREVVGRVHSPHIVIGMRIDRRFDKLRKSAPQYFDVDAAVAKELTFMRSLVQRSPRSLGVVVQLTYSQLGAGRYEDMLKTADDVLGRIQSAPAKEPPYDDMDKVIWIYDNRARALAGLQRWSEAEKEVRAAADRKEDGERNTSNVINLAWFYAEAGRSDDALATLLDVGGMSKFGMMQMHGVRYAAALQKNDTEIANESLTYLVEHRNDALDTWQWTLVRANRLDEAAALLIERLRDPVLRGDALYDLQDYGNPSPQAQRALWNARWHQIRDRPDVRKAIDAVGRVEKFRIPSSPS